MSMLIGEPAPTGVVRRLVNDDERATARAVGDGLPARGETVTEAGIGKALQR